MIPKRWWLRLLMLDSQAIQRSLKGTHPTNPLVNHDGQSILVAGKTRMTHVLFWCHICRSADLRLRTHEHTLLKELSNPKITEHECAIVTDQDIVWFDIAMDDTAIMG